MNTLLSGYKIIMLMPTYQPKKTYKRSRVASYKEMEVLDMGKRFVRYGNTGFCSKSNNCFTCQAPENECDGGGN